jgi:hypothetical protein
MRERLRTGEVRFEGTFDAAQQSAARRHIETWRSHPDDYMIGGRVPGAENQELRGLEEALRATEELAYEPGMPHLVRPAPAFDMTSKTLLQNDYGILATPNVSGEATMFYHVGDGLMISSRRPSKVRVGRLGFPRQLVWHWWTCTLGQIIDAGLGASRQKQAA